MRALDGPLSRRAQQMLGDPSALVYVGQDPTGTAPPGEGVGGTRRPTPAQWQTQRAGHYVLERAGAEPLGLGETGEAAYGALVALRSAHRVCRHDWTDSGERADCPSCGSRGVPGERCGRCGARRWAGHLAHMSRRGSETECDMSRTLITEEG